MYHQILDLKYLFLFELEVDFLQFGQVLCFLCKGGKKIFVDNFVNIQKIWGGGGTVYHNKVF